MNQRRSIAHGSDQQPDGHSSTRSAGSTRDRVAQPEHDALQTDAQDSHVGRVALDARLKSLIKAAPEQIVTSAVKNVGQLLKSLSI